MKKLTPLFLVPLLLLVVAATTVTSIKWFSQYPTATAADAVVVLVQTNTPSGFGKVALSALKTYAQVGVQPADATLTNISGQVVVTNGHSAALTVSNNFSVYGNVEVNGTMTINSTNDTTTVPNLVVTTSIAGAGTNALFQGSPNAAWTATQAATNGVYSAGTNDAWAALKSTSAMATNSATTAVDMTIPYAEVSTNDAFAWLPLSGVSETEYQTAVRFVTNSAATAKAITAPANVHVQGTAYVTNVTACTFFNAAGRWTNLTIFPLF